ncbi:protein associated with UVRAG as autophagy enhancer [Scomber scombrus]|uniref:protein associated with UVRAG as autophagy enhancer n=1 Tax=Scomber scombrus TaxID=13677 RepID=UPI002DDC4389|nr:protein associated with UVRAG as autophagy enhancer [Scomber scombrus]
MGSCRSMSSSHHRSRYVSWCVDSPPPVATTANAEEFSHQNQQSAGAGSIPVLLLSSAETSGGETDAPQLTFTWETHHKAFTHPHHSQCNPHSNTASTTHNTDKVNSRIDEGEDDDSRKGRKGNFTPPEVDNRSKEPHSLLHPEDNSVNLPRSSPVISRPVSWHGGGTDTSAPSSLDSPAPVSGSVSLNQRGCLTAISMEDLGSKPNSNRRSSQVQEVKEPRCVSVLSNLNHFLSGQQGLAEEHRGQGLISCDALHTSGLSTSTQHSRDRRSSGIPEISAEVFKTTCELEKENAHFIVVDMVLEVLEGAKWALSFDRWTSAMDSQQNTCRKMRAHTGSALELKQRRKACRRSTVNAKQEVNMKHADGDNETSRRNTHFFKSYAHWHNQNKEEEEERKNEHPPKTFSVLSTDSGFEDCGVDTMLTQRDSLRNAEWLALQLVVEFKKSWLPFNRPQRGRQSLRSSLQELPGTGDVAVSSESLAEEIRLRTRMRGSLCWAPPRFQIIFTVQPTNRRSDVVALQHFLCAGCGTEVEPRYIKKLRYCEYLGRYFCDCCHNGFEAVIPGRVLSSWDFSRYPVSDFSKQLLDSVWHQPLFDLRCVGKTLYSKVKELDKFRELQEQLLGIKKLVKTCRLSERLINEFEQLPCHLTEQPLLFSMDDLYRAKKGQLVAEAKAVLRSALDHVESCELCLARGFICEFCRERNIIFPFQKDVCKRCPVCKACFHILCFVEKKCPKCARIQSRKKTF